MSLLSTSPDGLSYPSHNWQLEHQQHHRSRTAALLQQHHTQQDISSRKRAANSAQQVQGVTAENDKAVGQHQTQHTGRFWTVLGSGHCPMTVCEQETYLKWQILDGSSTDFMMNGQAAVGIAVHAAGPNVLLQPKQCL